MGTKKGYRLFNTDPFTKCYEKGAYSIKKEPGATGLVEMLFCTSLVVIVGGGDTPGFSPRKLQIVNTKVSRSFCKRETTICELQFVTTILSIKLNRKRLCVVLQNQIHIYDITSMKLMHSIETCNNPVGVCAMSLSSEMPLIAYPAQTPTVGELMVFDTISLQAVNIVQAHKSAVAIASFNFEGNLLATASEKGTIVRVFSIPDGSKLHEFRRGSYPAAIYSISFNMSSTFLSVSSESETIHIFKLGEKPAGAATKYVGSLIPGVIGGMLEAQRNFAHLRLPVAKMPCICALNDSSSQILVVSAEGYYYQFSFNKEIGGECSLLKQYRKVFII